MPQLFRSQPTIIFCIVMMNIILSLWCIYADPIINNDAVTYLAVAQKLVDGQWAETFKYYSWPFYSILIAVTAKSFFIEVTNAAYLLNTFFGILISLAFVSIVKDLSKGNTAIVLISLVIILFFPSINKYRSFIIRDFGYLACYLWSFYFIVRFCSTQNKKYLFHWFICAALSCLFRFEGIIFLFIVPYFLFLFTATKFPNRRKIIFSLSVAILILFAAIGFWYLNNKYDAVISIANVMGDEVSGLLDLFFSNINQNFEGEKLTFFTYVKIFASNTFDVFYQLLRRMSIIYFFLAIYAYLVKLSLQDPLLKRMWLIYIATNLIILISFSFYNHFLVSRYTLATSLTLLLITPFAIQNLINKSLNARGPIKAATLLVGLLLIIEAIDKLNIENKKEYIRTSGDWLSQNTLDNVKLYSNNRLIIHYADKGPDSNLDDMYSYNMLIRNLDFMKLQDYEYVVYATISSFKLDTLAQQRLSEEYGDLIKEIDGHAEQTVSVYRRK